MYLGWMILQMPYLMLVVIRNQLDRVIMSTGFRPQEC